MRDRSSRVALPDRATLIAIVVTLIVAWINFLTTARWASHRDDQKCCQPDVGQAPVVVEPAVRQEEDFDVVVERPRKH